MTSFNTHKMIFRTLVLIAGICFWNALPEKVSRDASEGLVASANAEVSSSSRSASAVQTQPIETLRVGQRVLARNPEVTDQERSSWGDEPEFSQWVYLKLEMPKEDGSTLKIDLLRPQEWVDSQLNYIVASRGSQAASEGTDVEGRPRQQRDVDPASTGVASVASNLSAEGTGVPSAESISESATPKLHPPATSSLHHSAEGANSDVAESDSQPSVPLSPLRPVFFNLAMATAEIEESGAELVGLTIEMDLPEMGATGTAVVVDILPVPDIEPRSHASDDRQVVTATFRHPPSTTVLDVTFANVGDERVGSLFPDSEDFTAASLAAGATANFHLTSVPEKDSRPSTVLKSETRTPKPVGSADIGVTDNHLFWSVDRQEFVPIGEMEIGERVQTYHGETKRIASKLPRPGPPAEVYNLEVYGEHVYFVGEQWLLAHNACSDHIAETISKSGQAKVRVWADGSKRYYKLNKNSRWAKVRDVKAPTRGRTPHGNSANATGPHDLYAMVEPGTGRALHIGETGRGWLDRTSEHIRDALNQRNSFKNAPAPLVVGRRKLKRTANGKAAAQALERRYIETYKKIFGRLPKYNAGYR